MVEHAAEVVWVRNDDNFLDRKYSRKHVLRFDGGAQIEASSSPHVVPVPMSDAKAVDPEELFISALSSCHMLWFLTVSAKKGFCVDRYVDKAIGVMGENPDGDWAVVRVTLRPEVTFSGEKLPSQVEINDLHHEAHEECFIAASVKTDVVCEPVHSD